MKMEMVKVVGSDREKLNLELLMILEGVLVVAAERNINYRDRSRTSFWLSTR